MSLFAAPPNISIAEGLHHIFQHYCSPWKSALAESNGNLPQPKESAQTMDGASFARMCREAPELDHFIGRTEIDLIFSKTKPPGVRRLDFDHFLDTLLELAIRIFPDEDPTIALANFLSRFIFALFDQPPAEDGEKAVDAIMSELTLPESPTAQPEQPSPKAGQAQLYNPSMHSTQRGAR